MLEVTQVLGNVGEFVGALGVVATLIYLAIQVRPAKSRPAIPGPPVRLSPRAPRYRPRR